MREDEMYVPSNLRGQKGLLTTFHPSVVSGKLENLDVITFMTTRGCWWVRVYGHSKKEFSLKFHFYIPSAPPYFFSQIFPCIFPVFSLSPTNFPKLISLN